MTTTHRAARPSSLGAVFDPRDNALNAMRLVLAATVIVSHAWPATGAGPDPAFGGQTLGTWAVVGFFLVSGFLITRSATRRSPGRYARDRVLRIYPGYLVAMAVTGFVIAPLSTVATGASYDVGDAVSWFVHNLPLYEQHVAQISISDTLAGTPVPVWNGPVWSLFFEAVCYVVVGVMVVALPRWALPGVMVVVALGLTWLTALVRHDQMVVESIYSMALPAGLAFAVGSLAYLLRHHVLVDGRWVVGSLVGLMAVIWSGEAPSLAPWFLVVPCFWAAQAAPAAIRRVGTRTDISYGIYIYGWPVQMLLLLVGRERGWELPVIVDIVVVLALTAPLAWLSAVLVEQPAMRGVRPRDRAPAATAGSTTAAVVAARPATGSHDHGA